MRYMRILYSLLFIGLLGCMKMDEVRSPSEFIVDMGDKTVGLVMGMGKGHRVYCTGVWVSRTEIVTAHHCVQAAANYLANPELDGDGPDVDPNGVKITYIIGSEANGVGEEPTGLHMAMAIGLDSDHDIAVLRAMGNAIPGHKVARLADHMPGIGEEIYTIGHVAGFYWSYVRGVVSAYRDDLPGAKGLNISGPFIQLSAPIYHGNSGGGIFDEDGELVGIVSFTAGAPVTSFAIPIKRVRVLLKE